MLSESYISSRLPAPDLGRARRFYANLQKTVEQLRSRGVVFEEVDVPGLRATDGVAEVEGDYPSDGGIGERAAWYRDSEGNLLGIGQALV